MYLFRTLFVRFLICTIFIFNNVNAQQKKDDIIYLEVLNIPKIQHKIHTSKTSWKIDKSATITYKLSNDPIAQKLNYNKTSKNLTKTFYQDNVFLKLRYNPGKLLTLMLRKGDSAIVEYSNGKPFVDILNRPTKEHDTDVSNLLDEFKFPLGFFEFRAKFKRGRTKKEKENLNKEYITVYNKQLNLLDSLCNNDLLSHLEYTYFSKKVTYLKEIKVKKYAKDLLKKDDLHIDSYVSFLNDYVFQNLKKKIVNVGSGMARNFLESFDVVLASKDFSVKNKDYLLERNLKEIKKDHPFKTYENRLSRYKKWKKNNALLNVKIDNSNLEELKSIHKITNTVHLIDADNNPTSLDKILAKNKGKIVYIDFWASWCAPCRAAFPSYEKLKKEYKNKNVSFIFISTDKSQSKWEQASLKEGLQTSYLATNYPKAKFYKELDIKRIPRYLVFDASGKLLQYNAPSPKSDDIRTLLNTLLKQ